MADDPKRSQFIRCPLPNFPSATPDTLRGFYESGVAQFRVFTPPPSTAGAKGAKGEPGAPAPIPIPPAVKAQPVAGLKRETVGFATETLAPGAQATGTTNLGSTFSLIAVALYTGPARIRLYSTAAFRDADLARPYTEPPASGTEHGCIFDLVTDTPLVITSDWENWGIGASTSTNMNWTAYAPYVDIDHIDHYHDFGKFLKGGWYRLAITAGDAGHWTFGGPPWVPGVNVGISVRTPEDGLLTAKMAPAEFLNTGDPILSDPFQIPADASRVDVELSTLAGEAGVAYHFDFANHTAPGYPVSWMCSPEAIGSDGEGPPTGDIAYTVDNLGTVSTQVIYGLLVLREEK